MSIPNLEQFVLQEIAVILTIGATNFNRICDGKLDLEPDMPRKTHRKIQVIRSTNGKITTGASSPLSAGKKPPPPPAWSIELAKALARYHAGVAYRERL